MFLWHAFHLEWVRIWVVLTWLEDFYKSYNKTRHQFPHPPTSTTSWSESFKILLLYDESYSYMWVFSVGKYYLVDANYSNTRGYLESYKKSINHLQDYHGRRSSGAKEIFNHLHFSLRNVIKRCFNVLKAHFSILKCMALYSLNPESW